MLVQAKQLIWSQTKVRLYQITDLNFKFWVCTAHSVLSNFICKQYSHLIFRDVFPHLDLESNPKFETLGKKWLSATNSTSDLSQCSCSAVCEQPCACGYDSFSFFLFNKKYKNNFVKVCMISYSASHLIATVMIFEGLQCDFRNSRDIVVLFRLLILARKVFDRLRRVSNNDVISCLNCLHPFDGLICKWNHVSVSLLF